MKAIIPKGAAEADGRIEKGSISVFSIVTLTVKNSHTTVCGGLDHTLKLEARKSVCLLSLYLFHRKEELFFQATAFAVVILSVAVIACR